MTLTSHLNCRAHHDQRRWVAAATWRRRPPHALRQHNLYGEGLFSATAEVKHFHLQPVSLKCRIALPICRWHQQAWCAAARCNVAFKSAQQLIPLVLNPYLQKVLRFASLLARFSRLWKLPQIEISYLLARQCQLSQVQLITYTDISSKSRSLAVTLMNCRLGRA